MSTTGIGNLSTLIKRLEAATSRLEDITLTQSQNYAHVNSQPIGTVAPEVTALVPPPPPPPPPPPAAPLTAYIEPPKEDPPTVKAWDTTIAEALENYKQISSKIGGLVNEQAVSVCKTFDEQRALVLLAASCTKPSGGISSPVFAKLLKPLQASLSEATETRERNRGEKQFFNHLSTVSEGIPAVGWVTVEPKPGPYVAEMRDSAQFYANRVIKDFKDTDKLHMEWSRSFIHLLETLRNYIMKNHTTGLVWNPAGSDAEAFFDGKAGATAAAATCGAAGAPPPPPPPPPVNLSSETSAQPSGIEAVFNQLNQGENITKGLKKIDPSQMTHKNPALRAQNAPVSATKPAPPRPATKPSALKTKRPAKTELDGNKWNIEFHEDVNNIIIDQTELSQTVHVFNCKNSTIQIRGKINAVQMINCQKTSLLIDTLVSSLEITGSPSFAVQITGHTPTILLDSNDSGQIYLSKASLGAEIVAAKCSAINVSIPVEGGPDGEYEEHALPEQMKHTIDNMASKGKSKVKTEIVSHTG